ncbi:Histone-lysine N-methyltransferase Su(var)3-9 [Armadillidium vulgare]|nr:Histone-lysine N-methyltransferase Su(var)3-9 [Armadillidium vulgare]
MTFHVSLGTPIYECNKACSCSAECTNRVVQNGRKVGLAIFRTSNERGWGVKALEPIKKDQFVCEYVGEVITSEEAENRGMKYGQFLDIFHKILSDVKLKPAALKIFRKSFMFTHYYYL